MRRLPVYLLLDCSESMAGQAIEDLAKGLDAMLTVMRSDPTAMETAWLSIITFAGRATQILPLTDIAQVHLPDLRVRTGTSLGAGLRLAVECISREVMKTTLTTKGDYKPLVFLFTDGQPTDEWESAAAAIRAQRKPGIANIYAIGCGADVDTHVLREVTDIVLTMKDMTLEAWRKVFVWVTASVQTTSRALDSGLEGKPVELPALPDVLEVVRQPTSLRGSSPRQVFLHAWCARGGKPYVMRYARRGESGRYVALCAHPLDLPEAGEDEAEAPGINTRMLDGVPPCPYCGNPVAVLCECQTLLCSNGSVKEPFTCPRCHRQGTLSDGSGGFDVKQVQG